MKRYKFNLARLERVRQAQLDLAKAELAAANGEVARCEDARGRALESLKRTSEMASAGNRVDAQDFSAWLDARRGAHRGLVFAGEQLDVARDQRDVAIEQWTHDRQEHEVLVRLDHKRREEWNVEFLRDEANQLDEYAQRPKRDES